MFGFSDYFDKKKINTGYKNANEEIRENLFILDMLLEQYLDKKTDRSEGLIFSRGMKMTEAEIESYYFTKPSERISIGYDKAFADDVEGAFSYIEAREKKTAGDIILPIKKITEAFGLLWYERLALILALSVQMDMKYTRLFGYIGNDPTVSYPTIGAFLALLGTFYDGDTSGIIHDITDEKKGFFGIILDTEVLSQESRPILNTPLVIHPLILSFVMGEDFKKETKPYPGLPASYIDFEKKLDEAEKRGGRYYIECADRDDAMAVIGAGSEKEILSGLIKSALGGRRIAVFAEDAKTLIDNKNRLGVFKTVFIYGSDVMPDELLHESGGMMCTPVKLHLPDATERLSVWNDLIAHLMLKLSADVSIEDISDTYAFSYSRIREIISQAKLYSDTEGKKEINRSELLSVIFRYNAANFAGLATRVHTTYVWDDMEIAASQRKRLITACDRYRLRDRIDEKYGVAKRNAYGNGVSVLMYGAPGTGKTMAAQVVANELGLPLYRVDVSQIFSKYIGETEKNLGVIFEEAKKANVILFFDEADALFAKRTEVGDSADRYANAETAYLLQKIEEHNGMTILATNLYHNFDSAFVRRITYVVHIDSPDEETRLKLWKHTLPDTCKFASDVDFDFLAEDFELSGSNIKSILQSAAYMAGARSANGKKNFAITMEDVIIALRYEMEKLGRIIDSTDFKNYGVYL